jgi:aryl-alcohol dehydrogenase-like predicted oxidoreductase
VEQPRYNLLNRAEYEASLQQLAGRHELGIVCYSALAGGFLAGRIRKDAPPDGARATYAQQYCTPEGFDLLERLDELAERYDAPVAAVSSAWTLAQSGVTGVIVGPDSVAELAEASHAPDIHLSEEELSMLDDCSWSASKPEFVTW